MRTKEQLEKEVKLWTGINRFIVKRARRELSELKQSEEVSSPKPKEKPKSKKYTENQLYDLVKAEQLKIIKKLGGTKEPKYEKGRVNYILELQG